MSWNWIQNQVLGEDSIFLDETVAKHTNIPFFTLEGMRAALEFRRIQRGMPTLQLYVLRGFYDKNRFPYYLLPKITEAGFEEKNYSPLGGTRYGRFGFKIECGDTYYGPIGTMGNIENFQLIRHLSVLGVDYTLEGIDEVGEINMWNLTEIERESALALLARNVLLLCSECDTAFFDEYLVKHKSFRTRARTVITPRCRPCHLQNKIVHQAKINRMNRGKQTGAEIDEAKRKAAIRIRAKPSPRAAQFRNVEEE